MAPKAPHQAPVLAPKAHNARALGLFQVRAVFFHTKAPKVGQMLGATPPAGSSMAKSLGPLPLPRW